MTNIERFLSGEIEYEALTDDDRNAICAAMQGGFVQSDWGCWRLWKQRWDEPHDGDFAWGCTPNYQQWGSAAMDLIEKFGIGISHDSFAPSRWHAYMWIPRRRHQIASGDSDITAKAAIVASVCALARAQWPYKAKVAAHA
jgi:hypothetical protein